MTDTKRKLPANMTADEFLAWGGDGTGARHEFVDGELHVMSRRARRTASSKAQSPATSAITSTIPATYAASSPNPRLRSASARALGCVPDLGVSRAPDAPGQVYLPDPILLIEITSPGNKRETWDNVWAYATVPSVNEILIVQSTRIEAELLRRGDDGSLPPSSVTFAGDVSIPIQSTRMDLGLKALYAKTHPA